MPCKSTRLRTGSITCILLLICFFPVRAQQIVSGTITDALTGHPLPYATVVLKKNLSGIAANEQGQFDLHIPADASADTLLVNVFGYRRQQLPIAALSSPVNIRLQPHAHEIEEVLVTPKPPDYYIRMAMRRLKDNYPMQPFGTVAFYREMVKENGDFVQCDEAVFRTYCANYLDTVKNHDQVLLYRRADEIRPVAFMSEDRKTRKARRKGEELPPADTANKKEKIKLGASSFGGPHAILTSSKPGRGWNFLDTNELREYKYTFGGNTTYNDREVMIIEYVSRGKVEHVRDRGKIYIDRQDYAIVRIENEGEVVIPLLIRPLLFTLGLGVTNPRFTRNMEFQNAGGRWFPQKVLYDIDIKLTKRYIFSPNEHSHFHIDQVFTVSELETNNPVTITKENRFDPSKPIKDQVRNDGGHTWENVNVVKR